MFDHGERSGKICWKWKNEWEDYVGEKVSLGEKGV